jgi:hypothetical protein
MVNYLTTLYQMKQFFCIPVRRFDVPSSTLTGTPLPSKASQKYYCQSHLTWSQKWVRCSTFHYVCCIRFEAFTADIYTKIILGVSHFIFMIETECIGDLLFLHHQGQCWWQFISQFTSILPWFILIVTLMWSIFWTLFN